MVASPTATCKGADVRRLATNRLLVAVVTFGLLGASAYGGAASALGLSNSPPTAYAQSFSTTRGIPQEVTLYAADPDGDHLTYSITNEPLHGTLSGTAPGFLYTPAPGYSGPDSFTWTASDGRSESAVATTSLDIVQTTGVSFRGSAVGNANIATTLTINRPAGVVAGDFMLLHVAAITVGSFAPPPQQIGFPPPTPPTGWTLVNTTDIGTLVRGVLYKRRATAADTSATSYTVTFVQPVIAAGAVAAWSGVDTTLPIGDIKVASSPIGATSTVPSVFARAGGSAVAMFAVVGGFVTNPPQMTERWEVSSFGPGDRGHLVTSEGSDEARSADGQTGTRTASISSVGLAWIGHMVALRPAPAA